MFEIMQYRLCVVAIFLLVVIGPASAYYSDNPTAERIYGEGVNLMHAKRYQEAIDKYKQAVALDQHFVAAFINLASCCNSLERYDQAVAYANKAIENNDQSSYAYGQRAAGYYGLYDFNKALVDYKTALHFEPESAWVYQKCGNCLAHLGKYDEAIGYFNQALKVDPTDKDGIYMRGVVYLLQNKNQLAVADLTLHHRLIVMGIPHQRYDVLFCCIGLNRLGKHPEAIKLASDYAKQMPPAEWPYPIIKYFARQISAKDLLAAANTTNRITEAKAYLGADLADSGKRAEAIPQLKWVKGYGNRSFSEYELACSELNRLGVK